MVRKALNLLIDEDLVKKARNHGLNLSKFFENQLRGYFNFIEGNHQQYYHSTISSKDDGCDNKNKVGPPRFELESLAPKAKRIDQATLRALMFSW